MKTHPNTMKLAGLLVLVVGTIVTTAQAQAYARGSFTLAFEVEWRGVTVPAGHYTFEIQQAIPQPIVIVRDMEHPRAVRLIGAAATVSKAPRRDSALEIVTVNAKHYIHSLDISAASASFIYSTPKSASERNPNSNELARITVADGHQKP